MILPIWQLNSRKQLITEKMAKKMNKEEDLTKAILDTLWTKSKINRNKLNLINQTMLIKLKSQNQNKDWQEMKRYRWKNNNRNNINLFIHMNSWKLYLIFSFKSTRDSYMNLICYLNKSIQTMMVLLTKINLEGLFIVWMLLFKMKQMPKVT